MKETNNRMGFYPRAAAKELVVQKMEDELLVYNLQTNQAMCLNQTAGLVWENCDGKSSASDIAQKLSKKFKGGVVDEEDEELVMFAVMELKEKGLLENVEQMPNKFEGLSRREIVRKVGFASLVALPIVYSVVAPAAAQTVSCLNLGEVKARCEGVLARADYADCARECFRGGGVVAGAVRITDLNPAVSCCRGSRPGISADRGVACTTSEGVLQCNCICVPV